jgi:hypothetical protein
MRMNLEANTQSEVTKGPDTESDSDSNLEALPVPDPEAESSSAISSDEEEEAEEESAIYAKGDDVEVRCDGEWYPGVVRKVRYRWVKGNEVVNCFHAADQSKIAPEALGGDTRRPRAGASSDSDDDMPLIKRTRV